VRRKEGRERKEEREEKGREREKEGGREGGREGRREEYLWSLEFGGLSEVIQLKEEVLGLEAAAQEGESTCMGEAVLTYVPPPSLPPSLPPYLSASRDDLSMSEFPG
jgi:hypothetical protein